MLILARSFPPFSCLSLTHLPSLSCFLLPIFFFLFSSIKNLGWFCRKCLFLFFELLACFVTIQVGNPPPAASALWVSGLQGYVTLPGFQLRSSLDALLSVSQVLAFTDFSKNLHAGIQDALVMLFRPLFLVSCIPKQSYNLNHSTKCSR